MDEDGDDLGEIIEAFCELGCDPLTALACTWEGMSPSELREFLKKNPKCELETAIAILL